MRCVLGLLILLFACEGSINDMSESGDRDNGREPPPPFEAAPPSLPRLTGEQYRQSLAMLFGAVPQVTLPADTNPYLFFNIGAASTQLGASDVELYSEAAEHIAVQLMGEGRRGDIVGCDAGEAECVSSFITRVGERLFRRPLTSAEQARYETLFSQTNRAGPYVGLRYVLEGMLQSPAFLYRFELADAAQPRNLGGYEIASKLSFLLWNSAPDERLLMAARGGLLNTSEGVRAEAERLLSDPRGRAAVQAFFAQYLDLSRLNHVELDPALYPRYTPSLTNSMRVEVELLVADLVFDNPRDVREIFTSRFAFLNRELAELYGVDVQGATEVAYVRTELPEERAGFLTSGAFLAMNAHPTETSPTLRGKFVRERVLCEEILAPPDNVNTDIPPSPDGQPQTLRQRLEEHRQNPSCQGCHSAIDPPGFVFEHFDSVGAWRDLDNGLPIDASGALDAQQVDGAAEFTALLGDDPRVSACIVKQLYRHTMARLERRSERAALEDLDTIFIESGYRFQDLLVAFVTSESFLTVGPDVENEQ